MLWDVLSRNKNTFSLTFCISFSLICLVWQGNIFARAVSSIGKVSDRLAGVLASGFRMSDNIWIELDRYRELEKRYAAAQKLLEEYRLEKDKFDVLKRDNLSLREQLNFPRLSDDYAEVQAEVLGIRLNSISPRILINKGRDDGISVFMPVIGRAHDEDRHLIRAVVGMVVYADASTSIVQPITHPSFRLGVRIPDNKQWAMLSGNSGRMSEVLLSYIATDDERNKTTLAQSGAALDQPFLVYTSGDGGIFPRGIPVGRITREGPRESDFRTAYVRPIAPLASLDFVTVILKKPESWSEKWKEEEAADEHLVTEFGPAVFPEEETTRTAPERKPEATEKAPEKPVEKAPEKAAESGAEKAPATGPEKTEGQAPSAQPGGRRRIQNLPAAPN